MATTSDSAFSHDHDSGDVALGVGILLASLVCLGTWPALMRLCSWKDETNASCQKYNFLDTISFQEERQSSRNPPAVSETGVISCCGYQPLILQPQKRHPCHVYLDYSISYIMTSLVPIVIQLMATSGPFLFWSPPLVATAMIGGALLSLGNIGMQWSTTIYGAPLTTVVALQASLCVVLGTSLNYMLQPSRTKNPNILGCGVLAFLMAIGFASRAQTWYQLRDQRADQYQECGEIEIEVVSSALDVPTAVHQEDQSDNEEQEENINSDTELWEDDAISYNGAGSPKNSSTALGNPEKQKERKARLGLTVAFMGGVCIGFFSPAFNIAVNDPFKWHSNTGDGNSMGLSVPSANFWFSMAFVLSSIGWNMVIMTKSSAVPRSSWDAYSMEDSFSERRLAFLAGFLCALGNWLQFQGGYLAGFAAADMVQAFPLVATLWDVLLFGEFRHATRLIFTALLGMYAFYLLGIVFLASSIG